MLLITMQTILKTDLSFLNSCMIDDISILANCIPEIDFKLIPKPCVYYYGKTAIQHRDIGFFSNTSIGYYYSGQLTKSIPLTTNLSILLDKVNKVFNSNFNGILINKYNDGTEYVGAHSDNIQYLDSIGVVAISYGTIRKFRIRDKETRKIVKDIPTEEGLFIHMGGNFQKEFTHEIPKQMKIKGCRYSFTFRKHIK